MNTLERVGNTRGQHTAEYAVVVGVVIAAVVGMQTYVKRGLQARLKAGSDMMTDITSGKLLEGKTMSNTNQYEPYYLSSSQKTSGHESGRQEKSDKSSHIYSELSLTKQTTDSGSTQTESDASTLAADDNWR